MVVDTNAISAYADGIPEAIQEFTNAEVIAIPVIVVGEFRFGIAQSTRRSAYEAWLAGSMETYRVLEITGETAHHYATIRLELKRIGKPIPANDAWIAALCRQHRLPVMSRDRHFDIVKGIRRIAW